ncbi:MAG: metallophosphoesterase, partial [Candidatus Moraniibacteriota bacterium]
MLNIIAFFTVAVGFIQSFLFAAHWTLYKSIVRFFNLENRTIIYYLKILFGFLAVSFVLASLLSFRYDNLPVRLFYNFSAGWLGFLYLLLIASAFTWIIIRAGEYWNFRLDEKILFSVLGTLAIMAGVVGLVNANNVQITKLSIKLNNLPESWKGKTAVWVSDIHLGQVRGENFSQKVADKITAIKPDIVFVGGDLFDGVAGDLDNLVKPFSRLKAPLGVFYITGNHEEFDGNEQYLAAAKRAGMQILDNKSKDIDGVYLVGVDYRDTFNREAYQKVLNNFDIPRNEPVILLKHSPYYVEESAKAGVDFQLSGHTHNGQVFPMNYLHKLIFYGYEFGLNKSGNLLIYTSGGAGTWGPPFRFG